MVGWPASLKDAGSPFLIIRTATRVLASSTVVRWVWLGGTQNQLICHDMYWGSPWWFGTLLGPEEIPVRVSCQCRFWPWPSNAFVCERGGGRVGLGCGCVLSVA